MIYLDYAASRPPFPEALSEFARVSVEHYANPSAIHALGTAAHAKLVELKAEFAALCGLKADGAHDGEHRKPETGNWKLVLTSSGSEANNLAIRGIMEARPNGRILVAADAHAAAWFATERYKSRADVLPVGRDGRIDPAVLKSKLAGNGHPARSSEQRARRPFPVVLCSVVHACNETGALNDLAALGTVCAKRGVLLHVDGVQALGHVPLNLAALPVNFYTFSGHKFGAPRGIGGVFVKNASPEAQVHGGGQEHGLRSGTENVAGIAAAVVALRMWLALRETETPRLRALTQTLIDAVRSQVPDALVNGDPERGLPGLVSLSFPGANAQALATELTLRGFAVGTGSACHSGEVKPSRVILALGRSPREALGTIRVSLGRHTTPDDLAAFARVLPEVVERQRTLNG